MKDNLALLVDPVYTARHTAACQSAYVLRAVAEHWVEQGKNRYVYFIVPKNKPFRHNLKLDHPNFIQIPIYYRMDRFREIWLPKDEHRDVAKEWAGTYGDWDIVLTTRNQGFYWRRLSLVLERMNKCFVLFEPYPLLHFKKTYAMSGSGNLYEMGSMQTITSYWAFDQVYVESEFERRGIMTEARKFLSHAMVRALDKKLHLTTIDVGADAKADKYLRSKKAREAFIKNSPFTIFYTQRIAMLQRRFDKVHKTLSVIYSKLKSSGMDVEIKVCTNSTGRNIPKELSRDLDFMDVGRLPRKEYWKELKKGSVFISFSIDEGLPRGLLEATMSGVIGVVERQPWSENMFGREYPFLISEVPEAIGAIKWIYNNRAKAWDKWIEWYKEYFVPSIAAQGNMIDMFDEHTTKHFDEVDSFSKARKTFYEFLGHLKKSKIKRLDLLDLSSVPGARTAFDVRGQDTVKSVYHKALVWRWRLGYFLRQRYGWQRTKTPWILERK